MKKIELSMTAEELKTINDDDLTNGLLVARNLLRNNNRNIRATEKYIASICRVTKAIDHTPIAEQTTVMLECSARLAEEHRTLKAALTKLKKENPLFSETVNRWFNEETQRQYQAWQNQLDDDLIDPSVKPVHTCHCCCH